MNVVTEITHLLSTIPRGSVGIDSHTLVLLSLRIEEIQLSLLSRLMVED